MSRTSRNLIFVLLLKLLLTGAVYAAEPKPASGQEWDALVKKAEEEGEVAIYATDSIGNAQSIWAAFQKRYPKIKLLGTSVGRGSDLFPKLFSERRAGKFLADVFLAGPTAVHLNLYPAKVIDPMPPALVHPNVIDLSKWWQGKHHYVDPEGQYNFIYESALYGPPLSVNTNIVNEKEIKSAWDLVQPQWKGKYAVLQLSPTRAPRRCLLSTTIHSWGRNLSSASTAIWSRLFFAICARARTGCRKESSRSACSAGASTGLRCKACR